MERTSQQSRRNFFKKVGLGAAAAGAAPALLSSCGSRHAPAPWKDFFSPGEVILFQGDSITDAGRDKESELPNSGWSFGVGYANLIASTILGELPEYELLIYNRGISGNKVYQLAERWGKDCLELKPDVLSILIGVNDYWHLRTGHYDGTPEVYETDLRALLNRTVDALPGIRLVLCQPFVLSNTRAVDESWLEPFSLYQGIAEKLASEFNACWVPFQEAFTGAVNQAPASYWTADGVHPSMAGANLMARTWLEAIGK